MIFMVLAFDSLLQIKHLFDACFYDLRVFIKLHFMTDLLQFDNISFVFFVGDISFVPRFRVRLVVQLFRKSIRGKGKWVMDSVGQSFHFYHFVVVVVLQLKQTKRKYI